MKPEDLCHKVFSESLPQRLVWDWVHVCGVEPKTCDMKTKDFIAAIQHKNWSWLGSEGNCVLPGLKSLREGYLPPAFTLMLLSVKVRWRRGQFWERERTWRGRKDLEVKLRRLEWWRGWGRGRRKMGLIFLCFCLSSLPSSHPPSDAVWNFMMTSSMMRRVCDSEVMTFTGSGSQGLWSSLCSPIPPSQH